MKHVIGTAALHALVSIAPVETASAQQGGLIGGLLRARSRPARGVIGGATGAIIGQQAERRGRYYYYDTGCYARVGRGRYRMVSARYCY